MKTMMRYLSLPLMLFALASAARATVANVSADAHVTSTLPSTNFGTRSNLAVNSTSTAYVRFDLTNLPSGTTSAQVSKATLYVYVNRVNTGGSLSLASLSSSFNELAVTYSSKPTAGSAVATASVSAAGSFVAFDVTALVQGWVTTPGSNYGFALSTSAADVLLDSKENDLTGHAAYIDMTLTGGSTLSPGTAAGQVYLTGASGAVPTTPVSVSGAITIDSTGATTLGSGVVSSGNIAANAVTSGAIAGGAVTQAKIGTNVVTGGTSGNLALSTVTVGNLSATGTAGATTYLRGDGSWSTPAGGSTTPANSFATGVPYTVSTHQSANTSLVYCSPLGSGSCVSSTNASTVYATMPITCTVYVAAYAQATATFTLDDLTTGMTLGSCGTTASASTCTFDGGAVAQGNVLDIVLSNTSGVINFTTAFSCQ